MALQTEPKQAWTDALADRWEGGVQKFVELGASLPEDRLEWAPSDQVRTCGSVMRHVAYWTRYVADRLQGRPADDSGNELPAAGSTGKTALDALREASSEIAAAIRKRPGRQDAETLALVVSFIEHNAEHYGQLVVYARLLGIVPPSSRT